MDFAAQFAAGLTYHDFLARHGSDEHRKRWEAFYNRVVLSDQQHALLVGFVREMRVLCLTGAWCGDCVQQCPIFQRFAEATDKIQIRYFDRDANPELAAALAMCGGARVPMLIFLSEDGQWVGTYGDRTVAKYRQMAADLLGAACPTGIVPPDHHLTEEVIADWLREFERIQLVLRTSARLRAVHGD